MRGQNLLQPLFEVDFDEGGFGVGRAAVPRQALGTILDSWRERTAREVGARTTGARHKAESRPPLPANLYPDIFDRGVNGHPELDAKLIRCADDFAVVVPPR